MKISSKSLSLFLSIIACALAFVACDVPQNAGQGQKIVFGKDVVTPDPSHPVDLLAKSYYVVLDGSQSMTEGACGDPQGRSKAEVTKQAVKRFAEMVPKDAYLGLLVFDSRGITERVPLGIRNRPQFTKAVDDARADSATPLSEAIEGGYNALDHQASLQRGYGEYHLIVATDGNANLGYDPTDVVNTILQTPIVIHTIGICIGEHHVLNQPGKLYYTDANSPEKMEGGLKAVLAEQGVGDQDDLIN